MVLDRLCCGLELFLLLRCCSCVCSVMALHLFLSGSSIDHAAKIMSGCTSLQLLVSNHTDICLHLLPDYKQACLRVMSGQLLDINTSDCAIAALKRHSLDCWRLSGYCLSAEGLVLTARNMRTPFPHLEYANNEVSMRPTTPDIYCLHEAHHFGMVLVPSEAALKVMEDSQGHVDQPSKFLTPSAATPDLSR